MGSSSRKSCASCHSPLVGCSGGLLDSSEHHAGLHFSQREDTALPDDAAHSPIVSMASATTFAPALETFVISSAPAVANSTVDRPRASFVPFERVGRRPEGIACRSGSAAHAPTVAVARFVAAAASAPRPTRTLRSRSLGQPTTTGTHPPPARRRAPDHSTGSDVLRESRRLGTG